MPQPARAGKRATAPMQAPRRKPRAASPARKARPQPAKSGADIFHLLSVVAGAFCGLALYSLITPGHIPHDHAMLAADPRQGLYVSQVKAHRGDDGLLHVDGQIFNTRETPCRLAGVSVRFFDAAEKVVTETATTVEGVPAGGKKPFEARAHVPGAVRFEVTVSLGEFTH